MDYIQHFKDQLLTAFIQTKLLWINRFIIKYIICIQSTYYYILMYILFISSRY